MGGGGEGGTGTDSTEEATAAFSWIPTGCCLLFGIVVDDDDDNGAREAFVWLRTQSTGD